jgi:hypothetical protein
MTDERLSSASVQLYISEPEPRESGPILVCDADHNDIAEFYHNEHATVGQTYETALMLARQLVDTHESFERGAIAHCLFNKVMSGHAQWDEMTEPNKEDWRVKIDELTKLHAENGLRLVALTRPKREGEE